MKTSIAWIIVIVVIIVIVAALLVGHYHTVNQNGAVSANQRSGAPMMPVEPGSGTGTLLPLGATPTAMATGTQNVIVLNATTDTALGTFLVAANGMTLYTYGKDTPGVSNCSGACAATWPPYTIALPAYLKGGAGVNGAISTLTRADGSTQVLYDNKPLYFWEGDTEPGDANGQNMDGFSVARL